MLVHSRFIGYPLFSLSGWSKCSLIPMYFRREIATVRAASCPITQLDRIYMHLSLCHCNSNNDLFKKSFILSYFVNIYWD